MKKNLLILCGGKSDEHEISLISAKCVLDALDRSKFNPYVVGISRSGIWYLEDEKDFYSGELRADKIKLNQERPKVSIAPYSEEGKGTLKWETGSLHFDVVFPILHGPFGEDGTLQGLLDIVGVPYVGSNCGSSWICMDKALAKTMCAYHNIPVADFVTINTIDEVETKASAIKALGHPVFVKPCRQGSSVGVTKVNNASELSAAVSEALKFDSKCLIEKGIRGREIECAILGLNRTAEAALPGEIVPSPKIGWYSYQAKYLLDDGAQIIVPAKLDPSQVKAVQAFALRVFQTLECDGMARVDPFMEQGTDRLYLNEANTIPGFTPISMYPKMWQASGLSYPDLITRLIELAYSRLGKTF